MDERHRAGHERRRLHTRPKLDVRHPRIIGTNRQFRRLYKNPIYPLRLSWNTLWFATSQNAVAGWIARSSKFIWALGTLYHHCTG